ncbi:MAG: beta-ketoacyl-ACP synthase III [Lachnospiraceae bacterium]|nr:beta-ketoacyl-ACP synthase III [Lachnospiraceae bacterium]
MQTEARPGVKLLGLGKALPKKRITNEDMSRLTDTSDEWIRTRTGICARRFTSGDECDTTLAADAALAAIADAGVKKEEIGLLITATTSPDHTVPSVSCLVQERIGLPRGIPAMDLNAACSGFIYGLETAAALMRDIGIRYALVIGTEELSRLLDMEDRTTCVLFGDGAGAAVITLSEACSSFFHLGADGDGRAITARYGEKLSMEGRRVFRFAVRIIPEELKLLEERSGVSVEEIDHIVCHQANERIIEHVRNELGLPYEKFFRNLSRYGNTSAASIPLALAEMKEQGLLKAGSRIFCVGFGAGLTWGSAYLEL